MMATVRCPYILSKCVKSSNCSVIISQNLNGNRSFSLTSVIRKKSHYDVLGVTPKATQSDVKNAYYTLSKTFHPDRNEGCTDAASRFREIRDAYEILGNFKLRRLYDKGIVHTAGPNYKDVEDSINVEPDDAQTKFYKQRMKRNQMPEASGRTPIYNFDEWNNEHYGKAFERSQAARKKFREKPVRDLHEDTGVKIEIIIFSIMGMITLVLAIAVHFDGSPDKVFHSSKSK